MSQKSANVVARIEPEIKEQAESILAEMGISASLGINMFYHQIINVRGLPFQPTVKSLRPKSLEEMSEEELNHHLSIGLEQAKADNGSPAEDVIARLRASSPQDPSHRTQGYCDIGGYRL